MAAKFCVLFALAQLSLSQAQSLRGSVASAPAPEAAGEAAGFGISKLSVTINNFISCRYGVVCDGTEISRDGMPMCDGTLGCKTQGVDTLHALTHAQQSDMTDTKGTFSAGANLLVCQYGTKCQADMWAGNVCVRGFVCQDDPKGTKPAGAGVNANGTSVELAAQEPAKSNMGTLAALSPMSPTYDPINQSFGFSDLISCRYGVRCRGEWLESTGVRKCGGALVCKSGYKTGAGAEKMDYITVMQDASNGTSAVANLLMCHHGAECRDNLWQDGICMPGLSCRQSPLPLSNSSGKEVSMLSRSFFP